MIDRSRNRIPHHSGSNTKSVNQRQIDREICVRYLPGEGMKQQLGKRAWLAREAVS